MKRRLRLILSLLAACLLGIYGFQAYWLYGSYQLTQAQFVRTTHEALDAVVQRQQVRRVNKVFNIKFNDYAAPGHEPDPAAHWQIESLDTGLTAAQATRPARVLALRLPAARRRPLSQLQTEQARAAHSDSLALRLSNFVISGWGRRQAVNLPQLARAYRTELRQRQVEQAFRLDTVAATQVQAPGTPGSVGLVVAPDRAGYPVHTAPVWLNPLRGPAVVAYFPSPTAYVLRRLAGSLAGSLLLLGLTTACFGLMLSTILRQKKLAEIKNDFINNMTHELKTPLATVAAAVEALQDFGALHDPHRAATYLTMARQEARRLDDLIEKVLRIATEERHGLALHPEPVAPAELVAELVGRHELQGRKPVQFDVRIAADDTLLLDRLHLAGALNNLFDNAIKYSGERVRIRIRGQRVAGGGWQLRVADDGFGIAPAYQEAVFEQFFRVPTGNLHPVKGFGLGLYYVRQVVAGHGGRVSLRSEPGHGSEFIIWLPADLG